MNNKPIILDVAEKHLEEILKLNQDLVHFLSDLDMGSLTELGNMAEMFKVVEVDGKVAAFLIAVRENKPYASVNYKWFLDNYDKFLYVDRVVVSEDYQHMGIGRLIYQLPMSLCEMFIREVFGDEVPQILDDEEAMSTISKFFENNLNISETARQLYVHRNTLVYRLERIEKSIGLDIRTFDDAMIFKIATMVLAHIKDSRQGR